MIGVPNEIRTRVTAVKGRCPRPLDDGDLTFTFALFGGDKRSRTADLLHAMQALYQLSYTPGTPKRARIIVMDPMLVKLTFRKD